MNFENERHRSFQLTSCEFTESMNFTRFYYRPLQVKANDRDINELLRTTNDLKSIDRSSVNTLTSNVMQISGTHSGESAVPGGFGEKVYYFTIIVAERTRTSQGDYLSATYTLTGVTDADYASSRINFSSGAIDPDLRLFVTNCSKKAFNKKSILNSLDAKNMHYAPKHDDKLKVLNSRSMARKASDISKSVNNEKLLGGQTIIGYYDQQSTPHITFDMCDSVESSASSASVQTVEQNPYELMSRIVDIFKLTAEDLSVSSSGGRLGSVDEAALVIDSIYADNELDYFNGSMSNVEADPILQQAASKINAMDVGNSAYYLLNKLSEKSSIRPNLSNGSHVELSGGSTIFDFVNVITNNEIKHREAFSKFFNAVSSPFITVFRPRIEAFTADVNVDWAAPTTEVVYTQMLANILSSLMMISHVQTIDFILTNKTNNDVFGRHLMDHQLQLTSISLVDEQLVNHVMPTIVASIKSQIGNLLSKNGQDDYFINVQFKRDAIFKIAISLSGGSLVNLAAPVSTLTMASNNIATEHELNEAAGMVYNLGTELNKKISASFTSSNNTYRSDLNGLDFS